MSSSQTVAVEVLSGAQLAPQYHLGRQCSTEWVHAVDQSARPREFCVKPTGALWTAPAVAGSADRGLATTWSAAYFRRRYDLRRRESASTLEQIRSWLQPERQWAVIPDADAQVVRLDSAQALRAAAQRWPAPCGRISFEAMAADGIDGVLVTPGAIPDCWSSSYSASPDADLYGQFVGWEIESVAWLRPDHITVGHATTASRDRNVQTSGEYLDVQRADAERDLPDERMAAVNLGAGGDVAAVTSAARQHTLRTATGVISQAGGRDDLAQAGEPNPELTLTERLARVVTEAAPTSDTALELTHRQQPPNIRL